MKKKSTRVKTYLSAYQKKMDKARIAHIGTEVVVLTAALVYGWGREKKLQAEIDELRAQIKAIAKHTNKRHNELASVVARIAVHQHTHPELQAHHANHAHHAHPTHPTHHTPQPTTPKTPDPDTEVESDSAAPGQDEPGTETPVATKDAEKPSPAVNTTRKPPNAFGKGTGKADESSYPTLRKRRAVMASNPNTRKGIPTSLAAPSMRREEATPRAGGKASFRKTKPVIRERSPSPPPAPKTPIQRQKPHEDEKKGHTHVASKQNQKKKQQEQKQEQEEEHEHEHEHQHEHEHEEDGSADAGGRKEEEEDEEQGEGDEGDDEEEEEEDEQEAKDIDAALNRIKPPSARPVSVRARSKSPATARRPSLTASGPRQGNTVTPARAGPILAKTPSGGTTRPPAPKSDGKGMSLQERAQMLMRQRGVDE